MKIYSLYLTYKNIKRLKEISTILIKHGFSHFIDKSEIKKFVPLRKRFFKKTYLEHESLEVRIRQVLEELGPTFVKFGQTLSRRYDILPPSFIDELSKLEDKVQPLSYKVILKTLKSNYGDRFDKIFKSIDENPYASASLAQVHRATLINGEEVILKIKRENIDNVVEDDCRILALLSNIMEEYFQEAKTLSLKKVVKEFERIIKKELNFKIEIRNIEKMKQIFAKDELILVPSVFQEFSNENIIVMSFIKSKKITEASEITNVNLHDIIFKSAELFLKKVFETGFYHGDLHPGNLGITDEGKIVLYDFGNVGFLTPETSIVTKKLLMSLLTKDYENFIDTLNEMGWLNNIEKESDFKRELIEIFEWRTELSIEELDIISLISDIIDLVRNYNISLPVELVGFLRTILLMDSIGKIIAPQFTLNSIITSIFKDELKNEFKIEEIAENFYKFARDTKKMVERTPKNIDKILNKMLNDKFTIDFVHVNLEPLIDEVKKTGNKLSMSLIVSSLIIGTSLVFFSDKGPHIWGYPVLGILGFLSATVLGLYLFFRIIISGRF